MGKVEEKTFQREAVMLGKRTNQELVYWEWWSRKTEKKKKNEYRPINLRVLDDVLLIPNGLNTR